MLKTGPEKFDDATIQKYVSRVREECPEASSDSIALMLHECDYDVPTTISRIQSGGVEDGGWQTAKSTSKKKPVQQQHLGNNTSRNTRYPSRNQPVHVAETVVRRHDEYEFPGGTSQQSFTFDNSSKKIFTPSSSKRPVPSSIPHEPVFMHPTIQFSATPLDIQFGDVHLNESDPLAVVSLDVTSHLSDHLDDLSQQTSLSFPESTHVPPTSTPHAATVSHPVISNSTNDISASSPSAFTPYSNNNNNNSYQPAVPRDYSHAGLPWYPSPAPSNMKVGSAPTSYYPMPSQPQYIMGSPYPYAAPTVYQIVAPVDSYPVAHYPPSLESYPSTLTTHIYPTLPAYPTSNGLPTKYNQLPYDKDFFAHYGQTRPLLAEPGNPSLPIKDIPPTSKLSATAATFSQGSPMTGTYLVGPMPNYIVPHQDRSFAYAPADNRSLLSQDNRNGALYGAPPHARHPYNHYQQRTPNNASWYTQQQQQ